MLVLGWPKLSLELFLGDELEIGMGRQSEFWEWVKFDGGSEMWDLSSDELNEGFEFSEPKENDVKKLEVNFGRPQVLQCQDIFSRVL